MSVGALLDIRDLNMEMSGASSGCLTFKRYPSSKDLIFINKNWTFEKFDSKKARTRKESYQLTIVRLEFILAQLLSPFLLDFAAMKIDVANRTGFVMDKYDPFPLTYGQLQCINSVFLEMLNR